MAITFALVSLIIIAFGDCTLSVSEPVKPAETVISATLTSTPSPTATPLKTPTVAITPTQEISRLTCGEVTERTYLRTAPGTLDDDRLELLPAGTAMCYYTFSVTYLDEDNFPDERFRYWIQLDYASNSGIESPWMYACTFDPLPPDTCQ